MSMDRNNSSWVTLKKVWKIIDAYRMLLIGSLVLAGVSVALQLYVPILFGRAIDGILGPGQVDFPLVGRYASQILFLVVLSSLATWAMNLINNQLAFNTVRDIRSRALCLAFIVIPPIFLASSGLVGFVSAIFSAGTFGGIIMSVLPVFMLRSARKKGDQEPCWQCGWLAARPIQELVLVVFLASGVYALLSMAGMLPKGW